MGDHFGENQIDGLAKCNGSHSKTQANDNEHENLYDPLSYYRPIPDICPHRSPYASCTGLNYYGMKNVPNKDINYQYFDIIEWPTFINSDIYDCSIANTYNSNNSEVNLAQNRTDTLPQFPYVLTAVPPQYSSIQDVDKALANQAFYTQSPYSEVDTNWCYQTGVGTQRVQYCRSTQKSAEHGWCAAKSKRNHAKNAFVSVYPTDQSCGRSHGPVGAEVNGAGWTTGKACPDNGMRWFHNGIMVPQVGSTECNFHPEDNSKHSKHKHNDAEKNKNPVYLGGLLTIPKGLENAVDDSSQCTQSSDSSNVTADIGHFKKAALHGCTEIQKIITQYNIKSADVNIDALCKTIHGQFNGTKNILQTEPVMREMIMGFLYLSSSWLSLSSVLMPAKEHSEPMDACLEPLCAEFFKWQNKSKEMLDKIIVTLQSIPQEHEKYLSDLCIVKNAGDPLTMAAGDSERPAGAAPSPFKSGLDRILLINGAAPGRAGDALGGQGKCREPTQKDNYETRKQPSTKVSLKEMVSPVCRWSQIASLNISPSQQKKDKITTADSNRDGKKGYRFNRPLNRNMSNHSSSTNLNFN